MIKRFFVNILLVIGVCCSHAAENDESKPHTTEPLKKEVISSGTIPKDVKLDYDIVVIGGGPIGLSAAYHCAKAGQKVAVFEQSNFFNQAGSSSDLVRMFRTMYTEDYMADLAKQSIDSWKELETDAAVRLILMAGLLNFGDPNYTDGPEGNLKSPIKNLERLKMAYRILTAQEIMKEYPFKDLPPTFEGIFAPDNGCINVSLVLRTLHRLAMSYGAHLVSHAKVSDMKVYDNGVSVVVKEGGSPLRTVHANRSIITCGAYTNHLLQPLGFKLNLSIWEMTSAYFATDPGPNGTHFPSMWFQFMDPTDGKPEKSNLFYGFPSLPWGPPNMVRIAVDNAVSVINDPNDRHVIPSANDIALASGFVAKHCRGIDPHPTFQGTCLQTNVPDNMFVLDHLPPSVGPGHKNVALFTAGWAFKFVPLIGQVLRDLVMDGQTKYDISHFKITRPGVIAGKDVMGMSFKVRAGL